MKKLNSSVAVLSALLLVLMSAVVTAQDLSSQRNSAQHDGLNDEPTVQNGNGSLGSIYDTTLCGLNYAQSTVRLGQRFSPIGMSQPATFAISGMPACSPIVKAYFWCVTSGTGIPITANITNPDGTSASFLMTVVGQAGDLCWSSAGTYVYRADVTSIISGNGNYLISGLPVTTQLTNQNDDTDGATLLIMYQDLTSSFTGSIHLMDGAVGILGGNTTQIMNGFTSCGNSTAGTAFMGAADLQIAGSIYNMNGGGNTTYPSYNWIDFISQPTSVTNGQSSASYYFSSSGDCFCVFLGGLYWQTSCMTCNPSTAGLTITSTSVTPATCGPNGAASVSVSGGSGNYVITWPTNPTQYGTSANNLAGGSYVVSAVDSVSGMCGNLVVTIPYNGMVLTTTSSPVNCQNNGSATVTATGGTPPYTYLWSPSGGTGSTATNLSAGIYTVTVTDAGGCVLNGTAVVGNSTTLSVSLSVMPDSCPGPSGWAAASVTGGFPPYTFFWSPGNQITSSISNQPAGTYTLTVTDGSGCVINSIANIGAINNGMNVNIANTSPAYCGVGFMLYAGVNTSPATFSWQPTTYLSNPNIQAPMCIPFGPITYTVTATSQCGTDTDTVNVSLAGVNLMDENICLVTVDTAINRNVVVWEHTNLASGGYYNIYRETVSAGVYALIGTQHYSAFTTFTDMTSNPMNSAERYRISYVDSCGFESDTCAHHRSLFLQVGPAVPNGYNLVWTAYEGLNIATYNIYRGANAGNLLLIAQVPGNTFNYSDPNPPMGTIIYMVEAVHPNGGCSPSLRLAAPPSAQSVPNGSLSNLQVAFVGVDENNPVQASLFVSPNPGNGIFILNCNLGSSDDVNVTITDALGRVVYTNMQQSNGTTFQMEMDLSSLAAGMYNVQVANGTSEGVTKLVITK
jgi:hypothetical protein